MTRAKSTDTIALLNGDVMTLGEALDAGRLVVRHVPNFHGKRTTRKAWFADEPGTASGFEISEMLYKSRTAKR